MTPLGDEERAGQHCVVEMGADGEISSVVSKSSLLWLRCAKGNEKRKVTFPLHMGVTEP